MTEPIDGVAAARALRSFSPLSLHGHCLHYVWLAYKANGARAEGSYPTALAAWDASPGKHPGDRNPPAGVPVYWGARAGSSAGDVVISVGGGRVVCTDYPTWGQVGECTIAERERQIGRPYLGWTDNILGHPIRLAAPAAEDNPNNEVSDLDQIGAHEMFTAIVKYGKINKTFLVLPNINGTAGEKPYIAITAEGSAKLPDIVYPVTSDWALSRLQGIADGVK